MLPREEERASATGSLIASLTDGAEGRFDRGRRETEGERERERERLAAELDCERSRRACGTSRVPLLRKLIPGSRLCRRFPSSPDALFALLMMSRKSIVFRVVKTVSLLLLIYILATFLYSFVRS